jgi:hypothetical protein
VDFIAAIVALKMRSYFSGTLPNRDPVAIKACMQSIFPHVIVPLMK